MANIIEIINDMEHTNIVTFNTVNGNPMQQVEIDGKPMFARPFSCYNWEIILDGEKVCLNPMNSYDGDCKTIEFPLNLETMEKCDFWLIYDFETALIYEEISGEFLGEITKVLDPRNIAERLADLEKAGEI